MARRWPHRIVGLVVLIGAALAVASSSGQTGPGAGYARASTSEPWPAFVMEYREVGPFGPNGAAGEQRTRLDYTDRTHFTLTILAHPGGGDVVGRRWMFDGDRVLIFRPPDSTMIGSSPGPDGGAVPDRWLVPAPVPRLVRRPGARIATHADGTATVVVGDERKRVEVRYRLADGIPLGTVEVEAGQAVYQAAVTRLEITGAAGQRSPAR